MSDIRTNSSAESFLNHEITLFKAAAVFFAVIFATSAVLYFVGQRYFWQPPQVQSPQERGLNYFLALTEREPEKPEHWVDLGWYYSQAGEFEVAMEKYLYALELNPAHFGALYNAGLASIQLGDTQNAIDYLEKAVELDPEFWEAYLALGVAHMNLENWQQAEEAFGEALMINWHIADTHFYLGFLYEITQRYDLAQESYREALNFNPQFAPASEGLQRVSETD